MTRSGSNPGTPGRPRGRKKASELTEDYKYRLNLAVRKAAVEIVNGMAEAGPVWTGEFRDSYRIEPIGSGARQATDGQYPYNLSNTPLLSKTAKEIDRGAKLRITNVAPHANIAIDRETSNFKAESKPVDQERVIRGFRPSNAESLRGDIENSGGSGMAKGRATAPLDWLDTFMSGGQMQNLFAKGIKLGFKTK